MNRNNRFILLLVLVFLTFMHAEAQIQNSQLSKQKIIHHKPKKTIIRGKVVELEADSSKLPIKGVWVVVFENQSLKTTTDSLGRFKLDITSQFSNLPDTIKLGFVPPPDGVKYEQGKYLEGKNVKIEKNITKSIDITFIKKTPKYVKVLGEP